MPQTEEEWQLMEDIHMVTRHAHNEGVSKARIASLLAFMASAAVTPSPEAGNRSPSQSETQRASEGERRATDEPVCPECGTAIESLTANMGLNPVVVDPCGCALSPNDLPEGIDDLGEWYEEVTKHV